MPTRQLLAYGLLGLPLAFAALPIYVHVPHYYAREASLALAQIGLILLWLRLGDACLDPWLGRLADRLPRRTLLLAALPVFGLGFVALFNPPAGAGSHWLIGSLILTYLGFSTASIAFQAWGADLGHTPDERTRLTAAREGFTLAGVLLAALLPGLLAADAGAGVERMSWTLPPLLLAAALLLPGATRLPAHGRAAPAPTLAGGGLAPFRHLLAEPRIRRLLAVFILNGIAAALPATLFLFFVADVLAAEAASGPLLALYFIAGALGLPLWVRLAARWGRPRVWLAAMMLAGLAFAGSLALGPGAVLPFALICLASGLALGADLVLPAALAADLGEARGQAGSLFGLWNFAAKLNLALAAGLALPLLAHFDYVPGSGRGLTALALAYALLPLLFKAAAATLLWRWRTDLET